MINKTSEKFKLLYILFFPLFYIGLLIMLYNYKSELLYFKNINYSFVILICYVILGASMYIWNILLYMLPKNSQIITIIFLMFLLIGIILSLYYFPDIYIGRLNIYFGLAENLSYLYIMIGNLIVAFLRNIKTN